MAREYRRLSPAEEDEIWARLRAGYAAKPTARALGQTHLPRLDLEIRLASSPTACLGDTWQHGH